MSDDSHFSPSIELKMDDINVPNYSRNSVTFNKSNLIKNKNDKKYNKLLQHALKIFPRYHPKSLNPIITAVTGLGIITCIAFYIDYHWYPNFTMIRMPKRGIFLFFYLFGIFLLRAYKAKSTSVCLELLWGCNISITIASLALYLGRPFALGISISLVGLDQFLWYTDILSYMLRKKYFIGVAAYLSDPEQTFARALTSFHHLWFLPYAMTCLYMGKSYLHSNTSWSAMVICHLSMLFGRFLAPKYMWMPITPEIESRMKVNDEKSTDVYRKLRYEKYHLEYVNVNCGHEFFESVDVKHMHLCNQLPWYLYIPAVGLQCSFASLLPFFIMKLCSNMWMNEP